MSTPKTKMVRFLVISDTHGIPPVLHTQPNSTRRLPFPKADVLLHCGDISNFGNASEYEPVFSALKAADAELKIVIAGNHDLTLDEDFIKRKIGWDTDDQAMVKRAREMWTGTDAQVNGIMYLEEGVHAFTLKSGARLTIYTSPYTPGLLDWAFPYSRHEDRYNPSPSATSSEQPATCNSLQAENPVPSYPAIDIMLTRGPPEGILDRSYNGGSVGCRYLRRALQRAKPKLHCFEHIHEAWGAEKWDWGREMAKGGKVKIGNKGKLLRNTNAYVDGRTLKPGIETLCVNAAIMDGDHAPTNVPWIVDLELSTTANANGIKEMVQPGRKISQDSEANGKFVNTVEKEAGRRKKVKKEEVLENPEVNKILSYP